MKIQPLGDRVLVEPQKEDEVKKGGIIIPDSGNNGSFDTAGVR